MYNHLYWYLPLLLFAGLTQVDWELRLRDWREFKAFLKGKVIK